MTQEITNKMLRDLKSEKYDVIFGSYVSNEPEIEFVPVINQEMVVITPLEHPLKHKKEVLLEDLLSYPVIGYDRTSGLGQYTNSIYGRTGWNLRLHLKPPTKMPLLLS